MEDLSIEELELIMTTTDTINVDNLELPKENKVEVFKNFDEVRKRAETKSKQIIRKLVQFHFTKEMLSDKYAKQKISLDVINLTNLIFQLESSQFAIQKLLEEIDSGGMQARNFEVLAQLQKTNLEIFKYNKQGLQVMDSEYRAFAQEWKMKKEESEMETQKLIETTPQIQNVPQLAKPTNENVFRGTKALLKNLEAQESIRTFSDDEVSEV